MDALFEIIKNELNKHKITQYHLDTKLVDIKPASSKSLNNNNDLYFFANAFSDSGIIDGFISGSGSGNAMQINPTTLNMKIHKYQMFKGNLLVTNKDANNTLFVELVRVTPIPEIEND